MADDRADTIRQAIRDGAYRQFASRDILRHHIGGKRHHHVHTDLEYCAGQLHEQQRESYQSLDAGQYRQPQSADRSNARHDPEGFGAEPGLQVLQTGTKSRA